MVEERVCASGHVLDVGKENCSRCGGACVNEPEKAVDNEVVNEDQSGLQSESEQENVPENGSTEPENSPENGDVNPDIQEPKVEEELPTSGLAVA